MTANWTLNLRELTTSELREKVAKSKTLCHLNTAYPALTKREIQEYIKKMVTRIRSRKKKKQFEEQEQHETVQKRRREKRYHENLLQKKSRKRESENQPVEEGSEKEEYSEDQGQNEIERRGPKRHREQLPQVDNVPSTSKPKQYYRTQANNKNHYIVTILHWLVSIVYTLTVTFAIYTVFYPVQPTSFPKIENAKSIPDDHQKNIINAVLLIIVFGIYLTMHSTLEQTRTKVYAVQASASMIWMVFLVLIFNNNACCNMKINLIATLKDIGFGAEIDAVIDWFTKLLHWFN